MLQKIIENVGDQKILGGTKKNEKFWIPQPWEIYYYLLSFDRFQNIHNFPKRLLKITYKGGGGVGGKWKDVEILN